MSRYKDELTSLASIFSLMYPGVRGGTGVGVLGEAGTCSSSVSKGAQTHS